VHQPPAYEALTNQGYAPVSVYIDYIACFKGIDSHHPQEHRILYVLRAPEYDSRITTAIQTNTFLSDIQSIDFHN
jgi:hypothetical protein